MRRALLACLAGGCLASLGTNDPPRLTSFNGVFYDWRGRTPFDGGEQATWHLGEDFPIAITWKDPQGNGVRAWIVAPPPGLEWDEQTGQGVWHVPEVLPAYVGELELALQDDHRTDSQVATYRVWLAGDMPAWDTGDTADSGG